MWPALILIVAAIVLLSVWTATSSDGWERVTTDEETGESIGKCSLRGGPFYATSMSVILFTPVLLTLVMA